MCPGSVVVDIGRLASGKQGLVLYGRVGCGLRVWSSCAFSCIDGRGIEAVLQCCQTLKSSVYTEGLCVCLERVRESESRSFEA